MKEQMTLAYDETFNCVQCGYCLPACPTYKTMKKETHSPRGRINLVKMVAEGKLPVEKMREPIDLCLGCRACETVCPTNVAYGTILESAKELLQKEEKKQLSAPKKAFRSFMFEHLFPKQQNLTMASHLLWLYQQSGLNHISKYVLPKHLAAFDQVTPVVTSPTKRRQREKRLSPIGEVKYKVAFFTGCVMDAVFDEINDLSMKLLQKGGCEVIVTPNQTCCGALHAHSGEMDLAKELAKRNIAAFEAESVDFIVNTAGGCGAMLNEYDHLFKNEPTWHVRAKAFASKSVDISVLLSKLSLTFDNEINKKVTYQPSCHMKNVQKVETEPIELLTSVQGMTLQRMEHEDMCCGSAGIYNMVHYQESMKILDEKMTDVKIIGPEIIVTTNPGCLLQMKLGIEREQLQDRIQVKHLVELIAEAVGVNQIETKNHQLS